MSKILILAEKPDVAVSLAKYFKATRRTGYFEGDKYIVTFTFGHLFELYDCVDYDSSMRIWKLDKFPFIPDKFKYKLKDDSGVIKQFKVIKELANRYDVELIINAADNDREGELLSTLILNATGTTKPIKRMLRDEWTPDDIKEGLRNLKDNIEMKPLQDAGSARQLADWLIGINFSSVATLRYSIKDTIKMGRIIAPTTYLIYERDMNIANFKPVPYYELKTIFKSNKGQYEALYIDSDKNTKYDDKSVIQNIIDSIENKPGIVISKSVKPSKEGPERLFNLTNLQGYITSKYDNWTSDKVLKVLQKLYEGKAGVGGHVTYPRTTSRHLTTSKIQQAEKVLNALAKDLPYQHFIKFTSSKDIFDDSKVDSHGAIIPTYIIPDLNELSNDEKILYEEIKLRFISQFMPKAEYEKTEILTKIDDYIFISKGKTLKSKGWLELYDKSYKDNLLPDIKENSFVEVQHSQILDKKTEPPKHYTEETLLTTMENCGKNVDEDNIKNVLAGYSIGTPATAGETLKKIQSIGYVAKKGKSLYITQKGISLVETFPVKELFDVNFTGMLEKQLKDIEKGTYNKDTFLERIIEFTKNGVSKMKDSEGIIGTELKPIGKCPECKHDVFEDSKKFSCSNNDCKFAIWKNDKFLNKFKIKLSSKMVPVLLDGGKITLLNLKSEKGNYFDAQLSLIKNGKGYWNYNFDFDFERETIGKCLECGSNVVETGRGFQCVNKECNFILWRNDKYLAAFKKTMTKSIAKQFLKDKEAHITGLVSNKNGKENKFNATLLLFKNEQGYWSYGFKK